MARWFYSISFFINELPFPENLGGQEEGGRGGGVAVSMAVWFKQDRACGKSWRSKKPKWFIYG